jgi:hypothetical protein
MFDISDFVVVRQFNPAQRAMLARASTAFELWRGCERRACQRARRCRGFEFFPIAGCLPALAGKISAAFGAEPDTGGKGGEGGPPRARGRLQAPAEPAEPPETEAERQESLARIRRLLVASAQHSPQSRWGLDCLPPRSS